MHTIETIAHDARRWMRDFPKPFTGTVSRRDGSRSFELPRPNVIPAGLSVWATNGTVTVQGVSHTDGSADNTHFTYALDSRNGRLRIVASPTGGFAPGSYVNVEGYHYLWIADDDLLFFVEDIIAEHAHHRFDFDLNTISDVEGKALSLGAAMKALYSLLVEMARDIDTSSPEAVSLPLTQRYRQVEDLLFGPRGLIAQYKEKAAMLNVGLEMVEQITATRVSKTTGRLVPVYKPREWDDAARPQRVFPDHVRQGVSTPPSDFVPARVVTGFTELPEAYGPSNPPPPMTNPPDEDEEWVEIIPGSGVYGPPD